MAIGGYFELELPPKGFLYHCGALEYQSGRAAFLALLLAIKPDRVWAPCYICNSMLMPIKFAGAELCFYNVNRNFEIVGDIKLRKKDIIVYVNYFGVCNYQVDEVLRRFNPSQVVLDFSQAFFTKPKECLATIYSPRKFFGIPDGGLMYSSINISPPKLIDSSSDQRMSHLIKRLGNTAESGYDDYKRAEVSLNDISPKRMSQLTNRLLSSIDYDRIKYIRNINFRLLNEALKSVNELCVNCIDSDAPLCYPFLGQTTKLRLSLLEDRIFTATYWCEVRDRVEATDIEKDFVDRLVALPCDQRCDFKDISRIVDLLKEVL